MQPTLTGSAEASSTVTLYDGALAIGMATADGSGLWSIVASTLATGPHTLTASAVDVAGNTGSASGRSRSRSTRRWRPDPRARPRLRHRDRRRRLTALTTPVVIGSAEAFAVVSLIENGASLGSATADAAGQWQLTLGTLSEGPHILSASAVDRAGNTSTPSGSLTVTIDTTAPAGPSLRLAPGSDTGASTTDNLTNRVQPTLTGSAEASSTVTLYDGALAIGMATADGSGLWSIVASTLATGAHTLTASAVDVAGNTGSASGPLTVTVDTTVAAPTLALGPTSDTGIVGDDLTASPRRS